MYRKELTIMPRFREGSWNQESPSSLDEKVHVSCDFTKTSFNDLKRQKLKNVENEKCSVKAVLEENIRQIEMSMDKSTFEEQAKMGSQDEALEQQDNERISLLQPSEFVHRREPGMSRAMRKAINAEKKEREEARKCLEKAHRNGTRGQEDKDLQKQHNLKEGALRCLVPGAVGAYGLGAVGAGVGAIVAGVPTVGLGALPGAAFGYVAGAGLGFIAGTADGFFKNEMEKKEKVHVLGSDDQMLGGYHRFKNVEEGIQQEKKSVLKMLLRRNTEKLSSESVSE
jgi:hypothetical protein